MLIDQETVRCIAFGDLQVAAAVAAEVELNQSRESGPRSSAAISKRHAMRQIALSASIGFDSLGLEAMGCTLVPSLGW